MMAVWLLKGYIKGYSAPLRGVSGSWKVGHRRMTEAVFQGKEELINLIDALDN